MTCDKCQKALSVGDFPFCPHEPTQMAVHGDDVPGGFWAENGFDTPRKFYSKSEHAAALAAEGVEIRVKWAGEHDKHVKRWDAPSAKQLADAAELLSRPSRRFRQQSEERVPISVETVEGTFTVQGVA